MIFIIDADNNITAYTPDTAPTGTEFKLNEQSFGSEKELTALAGAWPGARLIEIWNSLPGATPVKKFTDRKSAVARIWKSIQSLTPAPEPETPETATKVRQWEESGLWREGEANQGHQGEVPEGTRHSA
ncbi:MAG: hypothetical protein ABJF23_25265 [Bryobacteraceae bacterium]